MTPTPDLLARFPGDQPGGVDLRYDPIYAEIKEARREEIVAPSERDSKRPRKVPDWVLVVRLASEVLATRSKDLQIAVWLTEALIRREGFQGLRRGCELLRGLLLDHWDHLYPQLEDGDPGFRAAPLEWLGFRLDVAVKSVPLTRDHFSFLDYQSSRALGYEADVGDDYEKQQAWQKAMAEGQLSADTFDASVLATPKPFYKSLASDIAAAKESLRALEATSDQRFPSDPPAYTELRKALDAVGNLAGQLLTKKLELEPDPVEVQLEAVPESAAGPESSGSAVVSLEPTDRPDAAARVVAVARFLRRLDPTDPTPYLMLRALRWGELRAGGSAPDPRLLQPPPASARVQLRGLYLDSKWPDLLEAGETLMGTPAGRGWLDLQRYALLACQQLGEDYSRVARAIRSELRALMEDIPGLADQTLMDDMPVATPETRTWLAESFAAEPAPAQVDGAETATAPVRIPAPEAAPGDRVHARALSEVRSGHPQRGIEVLMRELDRETSPRGRFLRQGQVTRIMVDHGLEAIAQPILEEMLKAVEEHRLEEWEVGSLVSQPLALMYKCLVRLDGDEAERQKLYLRICRLDPLTALEFSRQS